MEIDQLLNIQSGLPKNKHNDPSDSGFDLLLTNKKGEALLEQGRNPSSALEQLTTQSQIANLLIGQHGETLTLPLSEITGERKVAVTAAQPSQSDAMDTSDNIVRAGLSAYTAAKTGQASGEHSDLISDQSDGFANVHSDRFLHELAALVLDAGSMSGASQGQILTSARVVPMHALGSGQLSYLPFAAQLLSAASLPQTADVTGTVASTITDTHLADRAVQSSGFAAAQNQPGQSIRHDIQANNTAGKSAGQNGAEIDAEQLSHVTAKGAEIARRFFLMTQSTAGATLWYRDYELGEKGKSELKTRLLASEFIANNNINQVVVNGTPLWQADQEA